MIRISMLDAVFLILLQLISAYLPLTYFSGLVALYISINAFVLVIIVWLLSPVEKTIFNHYKKVALTKLNKMPKDVTETEEQSDETINTEAIRPADTYVKSRTLLEAEAQGHVITYRRVKRVNELVIDGNVFDEHEALFEFAHSLKAEIDGHIIEVGYDGIAHSYLKIDDELIAQKVRII